MTTGLQHVMPGQPFQPTAAAWNAFVDAARYANNQRVVFGVPPLLPQDAACMRVHFTIYSYTVSTGIAVCTVKYRTGAVPGMDSNNRIDVKDPAGCYFDEASPESALVGRWGHADYAVIVPETSSSVFGWICSGLCCPP